MNERKKNLTILEGNSSNWDRNKSWWNNLSESNQKTLKMIWEIPKQREAEAMNYFAFNYCTIPVIWINAAYMNKATASLIIL